MRVEKLPFRNYSFFSVPDRFILRRQMPTTQCKLSGWMRSTTNAATVFRRRRANGNRKNHRRSIGGSSKIREHSSPLFLANLGLGLMGAPCFGFRSSQRSASRTTLTHRGNSAVRCNRRSGHVCSLQLFAAWRSLCLPPVSAFRHFVAVIAIQHFLAACSALHSRHTPFHNACTREQRNCRKWCRRLWARLGLPLFRTCSVFLCPVAVSVSTDRRRRFLST